MPFYPPITPGGGGGDGGPAVDQTARNAAAAALNTATTAKNAATDARNVADAAFVMPTSGIDQASLSDSVKAILVRASTALQSADLTKTAVGLSNVDNTSDAAKPLSNAQTAALALKAPLASPAFTGTPTGITKSHVGLGNVSNTADADKPVSTAQAAAIGLRALASHTHTTDQISDAGDFGRALAKSTDLSSASSLLGPAFVSPNRTIGIGTGLTGGGDLSANRTISLAAASIASLGKADSSVQPSALAAALISKADLVNGLIPTSQLPAIGTGGSIFPVSSQAAMLALSASQGDLAIRSDVGTSGATFALAAPGDPTVLSNWLRLPDANSVTSVAGQQGVVVLGKSDVGLANVDNTADTAKPVSSAQQTALNLKAPLASPAFTGTPTGITKSHVGLANVDNTADTAKPISTLQQAALDAKAALSHTHTAAQISDAGTTGRLVMQATTGTNARAAINLDQINNTADTAKPVSTAQQAALDLKVPTSRTLTPGTGLTGGGDLSADRTLGLTSAVTTSLGKADSAVQPAALTSAIASKADLVNGVVPVSQLPAAGEVALPARLGGVSKNLSNTDLNAFTENGWGAGNNLTNSPDGSTGFFYVKNHANIAADNYFQQTASKYGVGTSSGESWVRYAEGQGVLTAWVKIADAVGALDTSARSILANKITKGQQEIVYADIDPTIATAINNGAAAYNALGSKAPIASPTFTGTVSGVTASMVGLGNVTNTSDANKPVSTAQQSALDLKAPLASPTFTGTVSGVSKSMVGLANVDNTADTAKPVSTAQQSALDLKAPLASPTFTGTVSGITAAMVGLGNVTNTSDANKPVSTAQQSALDAKAPTSHTHTASQISDATTTGRSLLTATDQATARNVLAAPSWSTGITAGTGLTGGGDLTTSRTLALSSASIASLAKADSAAQPAYVDARAGDMVPVTAISPGSTSTALTTTAARTLRVTLTANATFTIAAGTTGYSYSQTITLVQDTTGSRTVTWPSTVKWDKGTKPTLSTTASAIDAVTLWWSGYEWIGFFGAGAVA